MTSTPPLFKRRLSRKEGFINSAHDFHTILTSECERADRYGLRLSLALFELKKEKQNELAARRLIQTLHRRFRNIDEMGWFSSQQIGVILPHTPSKGAWKFAEDVYNVMASFADPPPFTVYTYPSEQWPDMPKKGLWRRLSDWGRKFLSGTPIIGANELQAQLAFEIDRANRYNYTFSLAILDMKCIGAKERTVQRLVKILYSRLRDSDEFGWYDETHIGIILPYASYENAAMVCSSICDRLGVDDVDWVTIYTYPANWYCNLLSKDTASELSDDFADTNTVEFAEEKTSPKDNGVPEYEKQENGQWAGVSAPVETLVKHPIPVWKRMLDLSGASIILIFASPLFCVTALLIKIVSPGPLIFKQERPGFQKKHFLLLKFRTMEVESDPNLHKQYLRKLVLEADPPPLVKFPNDPRVIPFGHMLRQAAIDELPQLINVLRGEMSLVGPRPPLPYEVEKYLQWHSQRFNVLPGMTGLWQISGKNRLTFKEMIRLDIQYEKQASFWFDVKILLLTIPAIIGGFFRE